MNLNKYQIPQIPPHYDSDNGYPVCGILIASKGNGIPRALVYVVEIDDVDPSTYYCIDYNFMDKDWHPAGGFPIKAETKVQALAKAKKQFHTQRLNGFTKGCLIADGEKEFFDLITPKRAPVNEELLMLINVSLDMALSEAQNNPNGKPYDFKSDGMVRAALRMANENNQAEIISLIKSKVNKINATYQLSDIDISF
ncbi:hypothetical protein [Neptuniibacter sp. QD37_11]|uniref:hypothetical protein n=1 Tax=Neptuniibacter sp. QD37_11 TaxID=3398209 RepID=UPI0039F4FA62